MAMSDAAPASAQSATTTNNRGALAGRLALVVVCLAVFLSALDQTMVVTALPSINHDLGIADTSIDRYAWIVSGYLLGYVIVLPIMGRVADAYGRRLVFIASLAIFALGSLFCALAPILGSLIEPDPTTLDGAILSPIYTLANWLLAQLAHFGLNNSLPALNLLVGARFVQAIGGGALVPVAMAVASDLFGPTRRGLALGLIGGGAEAGAALGPLWGAVIVTSWGWQWIFYINIPLAALLAIVGVLVLPRGRKMGGWIDLPGALLFGAFLTCLSLGVGAQSVDFNPSQSGSSSIVLNPRLLVASVVFLALFLLVEMLTKKPVIDVRQFRRPAYGAAGVLSFFVGVALIVALALIPNFFRIFQPTQGVYGGALPLLRMTLLIPVGAFIGGWLSTRFGCPLPAALGSILTAIGLFLMSQWPANVGSEQITLTTVIAGLGFGLSIAPISTSALNSGKLGDEGIAASMVTILRMTGMMIGLSWLAPWGVARFKALFAASGVAQNDFTAQFALVHQVFSELFLVAAGIALVSVIPALLLWRRPHVAADVEAQPVKSYAAL